jgi:exoribonuclease-2
VLKENIVRLDAIPLVIKANGLPTLERGARVRLAVSDIDLLVAEARLAFAGLVELPGADSPDTALDEVEGATGGG